MKTTKKQNKLNQDLKSLGVRYAGVYLVNKFLIKINTGKHRSEIPSYDYINFDFSDADQITLQRENYATLYHEYIHYVHEVSTMAGITQFYLNVVNRSIFSHYLDLSNTSAPKPITGQYQDKFEKISTTLYAVTGGSPDDLNERLIFRIDSVDFIPFPAYEHTRDITVIIDIPMISYTYKDLVTGTDHKDSVYFGKLFLYEGLAHHLDQITTVQLGLQPTSKRKISPEYKLMQMVTKYYSKDIDERSMLEMASMSLSYFNCGERFVKMIRDAAKVPYLLGYVMEIRNEVYAHLIAHRQEIKDTLGILKNTFAKRTDLFNAADHLCEVMMAGYDQRINNPVFEIDVTYSGRQSDLRNFVELCQMVYVLADDDDTYMRDYAGTYLNGALPGNLTTLLCHVDYYQSSVSGSKDHCCPLYSFCPHKLRQEKPDQCKKTPRLAFEDQIEYGWCHYGRGVAYMTGEDQTPSAVNIHP